MRNRTSFTCKKTIKGCIINLKDDKTDIIKHLLIIIYANAQKGGRGYGITI